MARLIPVSMPKFAELLTKAKNVGVIGFPGVGKTHLCRSIVLGRHGDATDKVIFHTDDYLKKYDHESRPGVIMSDLEETVTGAAGCLTSYIVEGNEVTRLVNRGLKLDLLVCVNSRTDKTDKSMNGLRGRLKKFIAEYRGDIVVIDPRSFDEASHGPRRSDESAT